MQFFLHQCTETENTHPLSLYPGIPPRLGPGQTGTVSATVDTRATEVGNKTTQKARFLNLIIGNLDGPVLKVAI